ncbi:hypothetical protein F2P81_004697 [Scophthalmus maximus]|uniref:Uncharacterized protein n=1 Tax=Scophthalmus maximus TaxID=52904 RepID=A0A6A4THZ8_SCOMX|nr:hypothetical protein F2P81_004697 [Scophthalmus maximus]
MASGRRRHVGCLLTLFMDVASLGGLLRYLNRSVKCSSHRRPDCEHPDTRLAEPAMTSRHGAHFPLKIVNILIIC